MSILVPLLSAITTFIQDYPPPPPPPPCGFRGDVWCGPSSVPEPGTIATLLVAILCGIGVYFYMRFRER